MDNFKNKLTKEVWGKERYYQIAKEGLDQSNDEGMRVLQYFSENSNSILDLGCGEGSRLAFISEGKHATGIDISGTAIKMGMKNYPKIKFIKADLEEIPLEDNSFDLVYSGYVLEHLSSPEKVLTEGIRLLKNKGYLILLAPNYGAPNRASPPFKGNRFKKLFLGLIMDLFFLNNGKRLQWIKVEPIATESRYHMDWDTTIEPYISSLISFLQNRKMKIEYFSSCWSEELQDAKIHQRLFSLLGALGIYPFTRWGPHLIVVAKK